MLSGSAIATKRSPGVPPQNRFLVPPGGCHRETAAHCAVQAGLARNGAHSRQRWIHHRGEPQLVPGPAVLRAFPVQHRPGAPLPGQGRTLQTAVRRQRAARHRPDPGLPRDHRRRQRLPCRGRRDRGRRMRRLLPGRHPHPRPRPVADGLQDRRRPGRAAHQGPGHPGRPVGRQRGDAAVRQGEAAPALPPQDAAGAGRAAGRPRRLLRSGAHRRDAARGHRDHHAQRRRTPRGIARRDRPRRSVRPAQGPGGK